MDTNMGDRTWKRCADELPDDDMTVLLALADGEVWTGFRDAGKWRYVSADLIEIEVTDWMDFPAPPGVD
jgi:hypothetical protein